MDERHPGLGSYYGYQAHPAGKRLILPAGESDEDEEEEMSASEAVLRDYEELGVTERPSIHSWLLGEQEQKRTKGRKIREALGETKKPRLGAGGRFKALATKLRKSGDVRDPEAVVAYVGRKKYGKKKFQTLAAKGQKENFLRAIDALLAECYPSDADVTPMREQIDRLNEDVLKDLVASLGKALGEPKAKGWLGKLKDILLKKREDTEYHFVT